MKKKYPEEEIASVVNETSAVLITDKPEKKRFSAIAFINPVRRVLSLLSLENEKNFDSLKSKTDSIGFIRKGVPKKAVDELCDITGFSALEMANILHTTDRTLRRYTANQLLNPEQSERLVELAFLYARGEEVFNTMDQFKLWMSSPVMALGNKMPKEFLDTSMGIDMLMDELGRIEYGIFA